MGPILSNFIRTDPLLRNETRRNRSEGDRDRRAGRAVLSLAIADVDTPIFVIMDTICTADLAPRAVKRPGQFLNTFLASYFLNPNVVMRVPWNDRSNACSRVSTDKDLDSSANDSFGIIRARLGL
jgi:hypothetical protein